MRLNKRFAAIAILASSAFGFAPPAARAGFTLTTEDAGVQSSPVPGVTTENFDAFTPGVYTSLDTAVGKFTSPGLAIAAANEFGGAGGTGNYFAVGTESGKSEATLTLPGPASYFGLWVSAADAHSTITFLSDGVSIASLNNAATLSALGPAYSGNPNDGGQDPTEKFAYLNFIATGGTTFNQVQFGVNSLIFGNEGDNFSIGTTPLATPFPGTLIPGGVTPTGPSTVPLPPAVWSGLTLLGGLAALQTVRSRRRLALN